MLIPATSRIWMFVPIDGPVTTDVLVTYVPEVALVADDGNDPAEADWQDATWIDGEAALLVGPDGTITYPPAEYMAYARLTAGAERVVLQSGRVRIGNSLP